MVSTNKYIFFSLFMLILGFYLISYLLVRIQVDSKSYTLNYWDKNGFYLHLRKYHWPLRAIDRLFFNETSYEGVIYIDGEYYIGLINIDEPIVKKTP